MNIVVLNPISVEFEAICSLLSSVKEEWRDGLSYTCGKVKSGDRFLNLIIRETGSGVTNIALAAEKAIQAWQPSIMLLVGIAGGVKDVEIGDVVVGNKANGYESGKETVTGFSSRSDSIPCISPLLELAKSTARQKIWSSEFTHDSRQPKVYFGSITSGEKVIASSDSVTYEIIKQHYNETLAVEMEAIGFARVCLHNPLIRWVNIRGISDLIDGKMQSDSDGMQEVAARNAATFAFKLLQRIDTIDLNTLPMNLKELVAEIYAMILPFISMKSTKEIGKELKAATNSTISELWEKVKPLFIEEYEDLKEDLTDPDAQAAVRNKLRKELKNNETLQNEVIELVKTARNTPEGANIKIKGKNIIQGSSISVGGDFRLGDNK